MAVSRDGTMDNTSVQQMIAQKLKENDANGGKLSKAFILGEFARALRNSGQKEDFVDFMVYGKDNT